MPTQSKKLIEQIQKLFELFPEPRIKQFFLELLFNEAIKHYRKKDLTKTLNYLKKYQKYAPKSDPKRQQIQKQIQRLEKQIKKEE